MMNNKEILFEENYIAAISFKNSWTQLASTFKTIKVILTSDKLIIKPHWYAKPFIYLLLLDLDYEIPINKIINIKEIGKYLFNYNTVEVLFYTKDNEERKIRLYLKKNKEFLRQINQLINK